LQQELNAHNICYNYHFIHFKPIYLYAFYNDQLVMDFVGRFENLYEDWRSIAQRFDLNPNIPHENKRNKGNESYLDYYTSASIAKVNELYAKDFELFGYELFNPSDFPEVLPETQEQIDIKNKFYFYRKFRMKVKISNLFNIAKQEYPNWDFIHEIENYLKG
jgi:hypothetical protein